MIPFEKEFDPPIGCESGSDFSTGVLTGRCSHPRRDLPPAGFRLTEQAAILYIYSFHAGRGAGIVRGPVGKIPGRPEKTARARAHLRGKRRGGAARGPAGALGGRRQLQGRQGFHRRRQGEGAGGRGPFLPLPRPALRQDRPRRDGEDDGGTGTGPGPGEATAGPRDACGTAGIGEDDFLRKARPPSPKKETAAV